MSEHIMSCTVCNQHWFESCESNCICPNPEAPAVEKCNIHSLDKGTGKCWRCGVAYDEPPKDAGVREWTLVYSRDDREYISVGRYDTDINDYLEDHEDINVVEKSAYEKLERELLNARANTVAALTDLSDAHSKLAGQEEVLIAITNKSAAELIQVRKELAEAKEIMNDQLVQQRQTSDLLNKARRELAEVQAMSTDQRYACAKQKKMLGEECAKSAALIEALKFYADIDGDNWAACQSTDTAYTCCHMIGEKEGGEIARKALEKWKKS